RPRAEGSAVPDRVPGGIPVPVAARGRVVHEQRALPEGLERGAPLRQAAVAPGEEDLLALGLREGAEALEAAASEGGQEPRVPQRHQLGDLLALGLTRVQREAVEDVVRDTELGGGREAVAARREGVADGGEGVPLLR